MARIPNEEQQKAIHKKNGVILSAGAGSGKTFVIIEHLLNKISEYRQQVEPVEYNEKVGAFLNKMVLMTFTKKAAGEMLVRLINRIESLIREDSKHESFWKIVLKNINRMQISTIHGYCHALIKSGIWNYLPSEVEILNKFSQREKIKSLFDQWLIVNSSGMSDVFLAHISDLLKSMEKIFSSPDLRIIWGQGGKILNWESEVDEFFQEIFKIKKYRYLFNAHSTYQVSRDKDKMKKACFKLIAEFEDLYQEQGVLRGINFYCYVEFFERIKSFPRETNDMDEIDKIFRVELKELHELLKKIKNDFFELDKNFKTYLDWEAHLLSAFQFIDKNYLKVPGLSFADLEYYVYQGLLGTEAQIKLKERFEYLIVDEFQDTSFIQFEIIRMSLNSDLKKLFCVGDKKQAIYGFRGGELKVFEDCSKLLGPEANLFLNFNYRSLSNVVEFNNVFFERVLPVGIEYSGLDSHSVKMEHQKTPSDELQGNVVRYNVNVQNDFTDQKKQEVDVDYIEAQAIFKLLLEQLEREDIESIAVLYRKLKPSHALIDLLRDSKVSFSAQVKIKFDDDPIISLYEYFLKYFINENDLKRRCNGKILINQILSIFQLRPITDSELNLFVNNVSLLGLNQAFWKILYELGISNSHYGENAKLLEDISAIGRNDPLYIYKLLSNQDDDYSFEMITGIRKKIYLLSAHASKGLEYDSVILGGIHSNGRYEGLKSKVGDYPKSFKWKTVFNQKNYYKSPQYHFEAELSSLKDFSESKRLLYVACTRAVKALSIISVSVDQKEKASYKNSWINAFRTFSVPQLDQVSLELDGLQNQLPDVSILLKDSMGILPVVEERSLGIISELSVTRLSSLAECPFKFYLKNICKIESNQNLIFADTLDEEMEEVPEFFSSKKRGTEIHFILSQLIKKEWGITKVSEEFKNIAQWVLDLLKNYQASELQSEKEFKFSFFGQMISAIPDLVIIEKEKVEIWDFKTGERSILAEEAYWFQLMAYAYGVAKTYHFDSELLIDLKLLYLDQMDQVDQTLSLSGITSKLFSIWKKTEDLSQVNLQFCPLCEFNSICNKQSNSTSPVASL